MIHVLGWYDHDNIGDEAYKIAFPKLLKNENLVFGETIKGIPDLIILGGGDVLQPSFYYELAKFPNVKKYAFSINLRQKDINSKMDQFEKIFCRNFIDLRAVNDAKIRFCPDFTFVLEGNKDNGTALIKQIFKKHGSDLYKNVVILTLNSFLCSREHMLSRDSVTFDKICYDLAKMMDNTPASFLLMPFGNGFPHNDRISNSFVYTNSKFWKKNVLLFDKLTVQETLDIFTAADAAISTRLHSGIFSCIAGIPFIDISHHTKTELFMEFIGKHDWCLNYWHFDYFKAMDLLKDFLDNKEFHKNQVGKIRTSAKKLLNQIIDPKIIEVSSK